MEKRGGYCHHPTQFDFHSSNERNVISKQKASNKLTCGLYTQALFS
jgi:hypothetical protein